MTDLVRTRLTVGDIARRPELGLTLLTAPETGPARRVAGAHAIEIAQPTRWIPPGWIMFTTGLRLRGRAAEQRALVAELDEHGIAALVYSEGIATKRVPGALLDEARDRDFPVLALPLERPSRTAITWIQQQLLATDGELFQRAMATQDLLVAAVLDPPATGPALPEAALAARLGTLIDGDVALVTVDGRVLYPDGADTAELGTQVAGLPVSSPTEITVAGRPMLAMPVRAAASVESWLVVAVPGDADMRAVVWAAAQSTARLLGLVAVSRTHSPAGTAALRADLLHRALHAGDAPDADGELDRTARRLGFDFATPCVGVLSRGAPTARVDACLRDAGLPHLLTTDRDEPVAFVQADAATVGARLATLPGRLGIGRPVPSLAAAATSIGDARFALDRLDRDGDPATVADFSAMPLAHWIVGRDRDAVRDRCAELVGPLRDQPLLLEALVAYLREDQDMVRAAARLRLHPNSLRYRMNRVEAVIGGSLRSPAVLTGVYSALVLAGLI